MVKTPNSSRMEIGGGTLALMIPFLCVKLRVEKVVFQKEFASVVCHAAQCLHSTGTGPGDVVLGQESSLGVGCGATGVADHCWLVDGLTLKTLLQLIILESGAELEEVIPVDDTRLIT